MAKQINSSLKKERKRSTFEKVKKLFLDDPKFLLVNLSNITSAQLQNCKREWKDIAELVFIKNTALRKALSEIDQSEFMNHIVGNVAILFLKSKENSFSDFKKLNEIMQRNMRNTVAKPGTYAQSDYTIEPHVTTLGADKVSFFQALNIPYKVNKGKLEILSSLKVLVKNSKVGPAHATLLGLLNVMPFIYYMKVENCFDEEFFNPEILSINKEEVFGIIKKSVDECKALALGANQLNELTKDQEISKVAKDTVALAVELGIKVKETEKYFN